MGRFCYVSQILPGKTNTVRDMWKDRNPNEEPDIQSDFWNYLGMTGFESWLQHTSQGDFLIHCLEGENLHQIFEKLRQQIAKGNPFAVKLQSFYQNVLGKNYSLKESEPHVESIFDLALPTSADFIKRGFFYPLLQGKEKEHRIFAKEGMKEKRKMHEASMKAFGISRLSIWLQNSSQKQYIVIYSERHVGTPKNASDRLKQGANSSEWHEIAKALTDHTGLKESELSPETEWLTRPKKSQTIFR